MSPAPSQINLLDQPEFENSSMGQVLQWAVTYGRYIMIGTEIIVLLAFISRFSLDRQLTDLREEIAQKQLILKANQEFENEFVQTQTTIAKIRTQLATQSNAYDAYTSIASVLPVDVRFLSYEYLNNGKIDISFVAGTEAGFNTVLQSIKSNKKLSNIELSDVSKDDIHGIRFHITATMK
jgi:hypothetical protein